MPYSTLQQLPDTVRLELPEHAQHIWLEAYNNAWQEYKSPAEGRGHESREEVSAKVAWAAVEQKYHKDSVTGNWVVEDGSRG
jgi:cation transport regulator